METFSGNAKTKALLLVTWTAGAGAAFNLVMCYLLIIYFSKRDKASLRKCLSDELVLIFSFLAKSLFNIFNTGTIVDVGRPVPFWIVLIVNPYLLMDKLIIKNVNTYFFYDFLNE